MMERAGMSDIFNPTRDIFYYFKLPFDAPLPVERFFDFMTTVAQKGP